MNSRKEQKQKNKKFNFIDVIIILLVLGAVMLFSYLLLNNKILTKPEQVEILYTIEVPRIKNELLTDIRKIEKGQTVLNSVRIFEIGEIERVDITPAMAEVTDSETGVIYKREYPEYSNIVITVRAKGEDTGTGYLVNGYKILVGVQIHFRTPTFTSYGNCTSVTPQTSDTDKESDTTESDVASES